MTEKFCVYCQEKTQRYINKYGVLECTNCEPIYDSDYSSSDNDSDLDPEYKP